MTPERKLAFHVILQCVRDVKQYGVTPYDFAFLTGQTDSAKFWFDLAGIAPYSSKVIQQYFGGLENAPV